MMDDGIRAVTTIVIRSPGSRANVAKITADLERDGVNADDAVTQADSFLVTMGKRSLKATRFFNSGGVSFRILLQTIISAPCDRLFHSIFDAESFDDVGNRGRRFLFSSMCNPEGIIAKTHAELGEMLTSPDSDVNFVVNKLGTTATLRDEYLAKAQVAIMRESADLYRRFVLTFSTYPFKLLRMIDMGIHARTEFAHEFIHNEPECCMDMFAKRVRASLGILYFCCTQTP